MLNMSNSENNTLIINNKNYEIDKIEICGKYNIELVTKNSNITLYLDHIFFHMNIHFFLYLRLIFAMNLL